MTLRAVANKKCRQSVASTHRSHVAMCVRYVRVDCVRVHFGATEFTVSTHWRMLVLLCGKQMTQRVYALQYFYLQICKSFSYTNWNEVYMLVRQQLMIENESIGWTSNFICTNFLTYFQWLLYYLVDTLSTLMQGEFVQYYICTINCLNIIVLWLCK